MLSAILSIILLASCFLWFLFMIIFILAICVTLMEYNDYRNIEYAKNHFCKDFVYIKIAFIFFCLMLICSFVISKLI